MNVFADEWRACLREHYMDVIRNHDHATQKSLVSVMYEVGFSESDLAELRVLATMHVDDVPGDFVPDLDVLKVEEPTVYAAVVLEEETESHEEEIVEAAVEEKRLEDEQGVQEDLVEPDNKEDPQQLSLF